MVDAGASTSRAIAWDWPGARRPAHYPEKGLEAGDALEAVALLPQQRLPAMPHTLTGALASRTSLVASDRLIFARVDCATSFGDLLVRWRSSWSPGGAVEHAEAPAGLALAGG
jgi:hypothetical protein